MAAVTAVTVGTAMLQVSSFFCGMQMRDPFEGETLHNLAIFFSFREMVNGVGVGGDREVM